MKDESIWVNASKLLADAKVTQRVNELRKQAADSAMMTIASALAFIFSLRLRQWKTC
jgi:hypothetical protein